jgi:hypothetical protein
MSDKNNYTIRYYTIRDNNRIYYYRNISKNTRAHFLTVQRNRTRIWSKNGVLRRDNNIPAVIFNNSTKKYYVNGKLHRTNGPAVCVVLL